MEIVVNLSHANVRLLTWKSRCKILQPESAIFYNVFYKVVTKITKYENLLLILELKKVQIILNADT